MPILSALVAITAASLIAALTAYGLSQGHNGGILAASLTLLAAIAGYASGRLTRRRR